MSNFLQLSSDSKELLLGNIEGRKRQLFLVCLTVYCQLLAKARDLRRRISHRKWILVDNVLVIN